MSAPHTASAAATHDAPEPEKPSLPGSMRAILQPAYGQADVLREGTAPRPEPGRGEVLVRVRASALNAGNLHLLTGKPYLIRLMGFGFRRPKHPIPGTALAGEVVAVGAEARRFSPGDAVYGEVLAGAWAEYVAVPEKQLAAKPATLDFEAAAALPVAAPTALTGLEKVGELRAGQRVLINGASGGVGTFALQIARAKGAEVTAVCSTANCEQARALGASQVVDYTRDDFTRLGPIHDLMLDIGGGRSLGDCRRALKPRGTYVACSGSIGDWIGPVLWMLKIFVASLLGRQRMTTFVQMPNADDLETITALVESGQLAPVIEQRCSLSDVPAAMARFARGHARAKTVVTL